MTKFFHNNAPITVAFMFICILVFIADVATSGFGTMLMASPATFQVLNPLTYAGMLSYVFVHANVEHIVGNLLLFLLIFPSLEERYGSGAMLFMMGLTAVITACCNMILFDDSMIGASGIVFMGIALSGFTNRKRGSIPITAVFVCCIYMGSEIWGSMQEDNISQFGHLMGGLMGILFGIKLTPNYLHTNNNYDSYGKGTTKTRITKESRMCYTHTILATNTGICDSSRIAKLVCQCIVYCVSDTIASKLDNICRYFYDTYYNDSSAQYGTKTRHCYAQ